MKKRFNESSREIKIFNEEREEKKSERGNVSKRETLTNTFIVK